MRASDRTVAGFYFVIGILIPLAISGFWSLFLSPVMARMPMVIALNIGAGAVAWIVAAFFFFRNRPVFGNNESEVRTNIKLWYRDAKKWMDEHPEHVDMKDL